MGVTEKVHVCSVQSLVGSRLALQAMPLTQTARLAQPWMQLCPLSVRQTFLPCPSSKCRSVIPSALFVHRRNDLVRRIMLALVPLLAGRSRCGRL